MIQLYSKIMNNRNLIRFDWAIKRLLRNKADFRVLEGFLSELLKEDVQIESVLESEGNQAYDADKFNRVDILVKNSKDELVIIEIQNENEYDYFHRMAYGASKAITEYISLGEPYKNLKKVYSINIVYFDLGQGEDYVYHGKNDFVGIHTADRLLLSDKQTEMLSGKTEPCQIFPEYYVIKVNQFDDVAKNTLDEWIYYLKNNEIKEDFTAKGMEEARAYWRVDKLPEEDRRRYLKHLEDLHYEASMTWTMKMDAEYRIREDERRKRNIQLAIEMKAENLDIDLIMKLANLTKEEVENL